MEINVYQRFFEAELEYNGAKRRAASVLLISDSEAGNIRYTAAVAFMPHEDSEDFCVPYDAYFTKVVYEDRGRRSKKKEKQFIENLVQYIDELATEVEGSVFWDKPLSCERLG